MKKLLAALVAISLSSCNPATADTIAVARQDKVLVAFTDEPCALDVKNLPLRAVWTEGKQKFDGCYSVFGSVAAIYFEDKTIAIIPLQHVKAAEVI